MKSEKGITLISLIFYILILTIITALIGTVSTYFYKNVSGINEDSKAVSTFNKFNMYFIEEVKRENNKVEEISNDMTSISFKSGNSFLYKDGFIYFNGKQICSEVNNLSFEFYEESGNINENIVTVNLNIGTYSPYSKTIDYVVESISF